MMTIAMIAFGLSGYSATVHKPNPWFKVHKFSALTGAIFGIVGIILTGLNLNLTHGIIGLISILFLVGGVIGGFIARKKKDPKIRKMHLWLGRVIYFVAFINLIIGISFFF